MSYRIVTDTCCDFPQQMYEELNLGLTRLSVHYKGESINEYPEAWLKQMYDGLRAGDEATTSAANPQDWQDVIEPFVKAGEDVLVMAFSSIEFT